jgi:hypothetical protein
MRPHERKPLMTKTEIVKQIVGLVVAAGTAQIVKGVIENNTNPVKVPEKVALAAAAFVVGAMAKEATKQYTDKQIDWIIKTWNDAVEKIKAETNE